MDKFKNSKKEPGMDNRKKETTTYSSPNQKMNAKIEKNSKVMPRLKLLRI